MDNGPQAKQLEKKVMLMTKDRFFGHWTTTIMLGSQDHLGAENLRKRSKGKGKNKGGATGKRKSVPW